MRADQYNFNYEDNQTIITFYLVYIRKLLGMLIFASWHKFCLFFLISRNMKLLFYVSNCEI